MKRSVSRVWHEPINVNGKVYNNLEVLGNCIALSEHLPSAEVPMHYVTAHFKDGRRIRVYNILSVEYQDIEEQFNKFSTENKIQGVPGPKC